MLFKSLPPQGITIFGSQLHTHLTGIRVITRHFRNGKELPELNRDNHYSTHFQEIRRLKRPVLVLPGDALITCCDYGTEDRINTTLGGFAISDEMCVNYVHYYPATPLEVCKSAISNQALATYFQYMHDLLGSLTEKKSYSGGRSSLCTILHNIGFSWLKDNPRRGLMETIHIASKRVNFLQAYVKNMENNYFWNPLFLDETWIFENGYHLQSAFMLITFD